MKTATQWLLPATASLVILGALPAYSDPLQVNEADIITNILEPCVVQLIRNRGVTEDQYTDSQLMALFLLKNENQAAASARRALREIRRVLLFGDANTPGEMEAVVNRMYAVYLQMCINPSSIRTRRTPATR